jgi:ubiquinone/menaquinone biosynthesis C-methylase UbiE
MNYFAYPTAAERYARGRPFFHPLAIEKIKNICCKNGVVARALDVGCGTGQSTLALLEVAHEVVGLDISSEMLSHAPQHARIRYAEARAEQIPFDDSAFHLITVGLAFHWFDQRQFMLEAKRVLRPQGWLILYNDAFTGRMVGNSDYEQWNRAQYLVRYPTPPRNSHFLSDGDALTYGFMTDGTEKFAHEVEFTPEQLVSYQLTQTNVIHAVETGKEDLQSVAHWLLNSVQPFFTTAVERFVFSCEVRFFKRSGS